MAWLDTHSITDLPIAQRANMSGNIAFNFLGVVAGNLTNATTAGAAADAAVAADQIADQCIGNQCARGFTIADNMGFTFGSTVAAFTASGPDVDGHELRMIC